MENENDTEYRIEKLEFDKEELEEEIHTTEVTIQKLKELNEGIPIGVTNVKINRLIKELESNKANDEEVIEQLEHDINKIRGIEDR